MRLCMFQMYKKNNLQNTALGGLLSQIILGDFIA